MAVNLLDFYGPGWRIEPKYSPKVLLGNWYEERMRSDRGFYDLNHHPTRADLLPYRNWQPDVTVRRKPSPDNEQRQHENMLNHYDGDKDEQPRVSGNYGLKEQLERKWKSGAAGVNRGALNTTYTVDYSEWPRRSYVHRMPELARSTPNLTLQQKIQAARTVPCSDPTHHHDPDVRDPPFGTSRVASGQATSRYSRHMMVL